jgi:putative transposase
LCRAVDKIGDTVDFLLSAMQDLAAARRFLERTINLHRLPDKICIDKKGVHIAGIRSVKVDDCVHIEFAPEQISE